MSKRWGTPSQWAPANSGMKRQAGPTKAVTRLADVARVCETHLKTSTSEKTTSETVEGVNQMDLIVCRCQIPDFVVEG
jgi:hypothetical protein